MVVLKQENNVRWVQEVQQFEKGKYFCIKKQIKFDSDYINGIKKGDWVTEKVQLIKEVK